MKLVAEHNYEKCLLIAQEAMTPYFIENNIPWDYNKRLELYKNLELFTIEEGMNFIGFIAFRIKDSDFFLADIQIQEQFRNRGFGTKVLEKALAIAKERGHEKIFLKVFKTSPALNLYTRMGFTYISEEKFVYLLCKNTQSHK